ncbi:cation-translocating P-type ATPase [Miltoncostaea marina]|uniref:cation-translocating P-type ATPase n=1 Tax=Miltoncostaea marina TaxID=2843215 RepID=UPI001C3D8BD9|nr:cation-translocating P-type ATPase [Miltoncostaea marina]
MAGSGTAEPWARRADEVAAALGTDLRRGLSATAATTALAEHGPNELPDADRASPLRILLGQVGSPMILLLAGAGVLSAVLGDLTEAVVILVVVVLNGWIGFSQEYRAERAMASLRALAAPTVRAVRDGAPADVPARELVPGDLVLLEAGSLVPADGRLVEAHALRIEESPLTGESVPVDKGTGPVERSAPLAERTSMAHSGTSVAAGRGALLVTATGVGTEIGRVARLLGDAEGVRTPLQRRLDVLVRGLAAAAGVIVLVVFGLGLARDEELETLLLTAVSLAVAAIPESLPAVVTVTLALGAQRMLDRQALVRRLYAVETLGSVTTICSDKTGTLTQNRMTITVLDMAGDRRELDRDGADEGIDHLLGNPTLCLLVAGGALCNDTTVADDGSLLGDPTETALVDVAGRYGMDARALVASLPRVAELPFDSERKRMTTVHRLAADPGDAAPAVRAVREQLRALAGDRGLVSVTKGAVDGLLARCDTVSIGEAVVPLDDDGRARARAAADELAAQGVRVLGVAVRPWPDPDGVPGDERLERALTLVGFEGMIDPARPEVRDAIAVCRRAGVRVIMITGDHPLTATSIGRDLGLAGDGDRAVTGAELDGMDDVALERTVREASIYARVAPEHKIRLVEVLQRGRGVVAMTGDGVNDAPALKQADIGVAMGVTGTDVTKDAADMVLRDDNFATIVAAVHEGRVVFDNIRKFVRNILSGNLAEVSIMVLAPLAGMPIPLLPLQILWLNLVTDGLPAMALAVEPPEPDVMRRPPTPRDESLLGADRGRRIATRGAALTVLTFLPAYGLWEAGDDAWQTVLFTSIAAAELAGGFAMRSERVSLARLGLASNRAMLAAVAATAALQVLVVSVPFARDLLGLRPLHPAHWLLVAGIALAYLVVVESDKAWQRRAAATAGR